MNWGYTSIAIALAAFAALIPTGIVRADEQLRTDQLMWRCEVNTAKPAGQLEMVWCAAFLAGYNEFNALLPAAHRERIFCPPESGTSNDQLRLIFLKWAKDHPTELHESARVSALVSLVQAFPCPK